MTTFRPLFATAAAVRKLRKRMGMTQCEFWSHVGVTQSGGSRYESGRAIPIQVAWALQIAYGTDAQSSALVDSLRHERRPSD